MNKKNAKALLMGLAAMTLVACGGTPVSNESRPVVSESSEEPVISVVNPYVDIETIDIEGGDYMVNTTIYSFDKANKKMKVTQYEDYESYKKNEGTLLFDVAVRFVLVNNNYNAIYFENEGLIYLLRKNADAMQMVTKNGGVTSTLPAFLVAEIAQFSYGNYRSDKQSQNKADEEGNYIYDSQNNTIREEFYLYLELSETKASIYVEDSEFNRSETPLHSITNYTVILANGKLLIKIPHENGSFNCSLTARSETTITFTNSMERKGDYSCAGTFTKILK